MFACLFHLSTGGKQGKISRSVSLWMYGQGYSRPGPLTEDFRKGLGSPIWMASWGLSCSFPSCCCLDGHMPCCSPSLELSQAALHEDMAPPYGHGNQPGEERRMQGNGWLIMPTALPSGQDNPGLAPELPVGEVRKVCFPPKASIRPCSVPSQVNVQQRTQYTDLTERCCGELARDGPHKTVIWNSEPSHKVCFQRLEYTWSHSMLVSIGLSKSRRMSPTNSAKQYN